MIFIVSATIEELWRRRFIPGAAIATAVLLALTGWGFSYLNHLHTPRGPVTHLEVLTVSAVMVILIAYLFSFLLAVAAVFLAAPSFANDIESGVLLPVFTRPLSRAALLCGKALAYAIVVSVYAAFAAGCEFLIVRAATGYVPPHPGAAIGYLCLSAIVMTAFAMLLSTRLPAISASIVAFVIFIIVRIGGIAQSIALFYHNETVSHAATITQLILPSDAMWQSALYRLEPAAMLASVSNARVWPGPLFVLAPPPPAMEIWTLAWIVGVVALASRSLRLRDL